MDTAFKRKKFISKYNFEDGNYGIESRNATIPDLKNRLIYVTKS